MKSKSTSVVIDLPSLSGKTAAAVLDILYAFATVIQQYYKKRLSTQTHHPKIRSK